MKSERFNVKRKLIKLPRLDSPLLTEGAKDEFELSLLLHSSFKSLAPNS